MASYYDPTNKGDLTPDDLGYFQVNKRRLNDTYAINTAQNNYTKAAAQNQYNRSRADAVAKFADMRTKLPSTYAHRGILNSGIYQRGVGQFEDDAARSLKNLESSYMDQLYGMELAGGQLGQVRDSGLNDIDTQEAARRATAASLRAGGVA